MVARLAGGTKDVAGEINSQLFMEQAKDYEDYVDDSNWNKILEALTLMEASHPFLSVRAASISQWCKNTNFGLLISGGTSALLRRESCPRCGEPVDPNWAFCRKCGARLK